MGETIIVRDLVEREGTAAAASAMLAAGVPVRTVADLLGHSDARMILGTCAHTVPELTREAARRMAYVEEVAR